MTNACLAKSSLEASADREMLADPSRPQGLPDACADPADEHPILIGGRWVETGCHQVVRDPEDGAVVGRVCLATTAEAALALTCLPRAIKVARSLPSHARASILERTAGLVEASAEAFAILIAREGVKTIREARLEVARAVTTLKLASHAAVTLTGETIAFDQRPGSEGRTGYMLREPVGAVLAITPFNDPLNLVAHKLGPAIAAGNAVILKPHEQTPLTALKLAECLLAAGLPEEILQVLPGSGRVIGPELLAGDAIRMVSFTGGLETGRSIAKLAGLKRLEMELGSNCPTIVMADADLDRAAEACVSGAFWAAGQNCLHVQRIIVERSVAVPFRERLIARASKIRRGPKLNEATDMGCLVSEEAGSRLLGSVRDATQRGARVLTGGSVQGTAFEPTVLEDVPDDHALATEEVYGPVTVLSEAGDIGHAIALSSGPVKSLAEIMIG